MEKRVVIVIYFCAISHIFKGETLQKTALLSRCPNTKFGATTRKVISSQVVTELDCVDYCSKEDKCLSLNFIHDPSQDTGMRPAKI